MLFHNHFTPFSNRFKKAYPVKGTSVNIFASENNRTQNNNLTNIFNPHFESRIV